jgi:hypothetical protein
MAHATEALLAYGYNLGSPDEGWNLEQADLKGGLTTPWYSDYADNDDFITLAHQVIGSTSGARIVEAYATGNAVYLLATAVYTSTAVEEIDPYQLSRSPDQHGWNTQLRFALDALGITPDEKRARWLLCSRAPH